MRICRWVGHGTEERMETVVFLLLLLACTFSPSRGAVANLVLLQDAVKEVSFNV